VIPVEDDLAVAYPGSRFEIPEERRGIVSGAEAGVQVLRRR